MSEDEARVERVAQAQVEAVAKALEDIYDQFLDPTPAQRARAAIAAIAATAWQPIETAPRDGTKIDLWHPTGGRFANAFWCKQTYALYEPWGWSNSSFGRIVGVTHWMLLPEPPMTTFREKKT